MIPTTDDYTPALDTDQLAIMTEGELAALYADHEGKWPYSENSDLLSRETALQMRVLLLQYMSTQELHACSVRELFHLYVEFLGLILEDLHPEKFDPETKAWAAERAAAMFGDTSKLDIVGSSRPSIEETR
jgi:hypothetical protein